MPRLIKFKKISKSKYEFSPKIKTSGHDNKIQIPAKMTKQIPEPRKVKVTIEVLEDE